MEDNDFHGFRKSLDKKLKYLTQVTTVLPQDKQKLLLNKWNKNYGEKYSWTERTKKLLRTVYFLVGKNFALRSRREHHDLRHGMGSQIKIVGMGQEKKVIYLEDLSKNNNGGLKHANYKAKTGAIFSTDGSHCPVEIIEKYLKKVSPEIQIVLLYTARKGKRKKLVPQPSNWCKHSGFHNSKYCKRRRLGYYQFMERLFFESFCHYRFK